METIEEIRKFFEPKKNSYKQVLKYVKGLLDEYHRYTDEGCRAICRVVTRKDYTGEEFKMEEKIQEKLKDKREENPNYGLSDIEDFVGLRVVCVYPSDVDIVRAYIKKLYENGKLARCDEELVIGKVKVKVKGGIQKKESGYKAWHFTVAPPGKLNLFNCEIQVMTILEEGATVKSHDLIYKPLGGIVKERHARQAKLLSDSLRVIDEQSKILEQEIRRKWHIEEEKKNAAKIALIRHITKRLKFPEGSETQKLRDHIIANEKELCHKDIDKELNWIKRIVNKKLDESLCSVVSLLAIIRRVHDLDEYALELLDKYLVQVTDDRTKSEGHRFKSLFLSTLGKREAIEEAEKALQYAIKTGDKKLINLAKGNIAYFIAEFNQVDKEATARNYSEEIYEADKIAYDLDTHGYVKIVFAKDSNEVKEGWELCKRAFEEDEDKEVARAFLHVSECKAIEQLWDFLEEGLE